MAITGAHSSQSLVPKRSICSHGSGRHCDHTDLIHGLRKCKLRPRDLAMILEPLMSHIVLTMGCHREAINRGLLNRETQGHMMGLLWIQDSAETASVTTWSRRTGMLPSSPQFSKCPSEMIHSNRLPRSPSVASTLTRFSQTPGRYRFSTAAASRLHYLPWTAWVDSESGKCDDGAPYQSKSHRSCPSCRPIR